MGLNTDISWADSTFNPWRGCIEVSPGCANCYAREMSLRNPKVLGKWGAANGGGARVMAAESYWRQPLLWNRDMGKGHRVFCASLADWLEDWPGDILNAQGDATSLTMDDLRARLLLLIHQTGNLKWLLLTKRPENWLPLMERIAERHDERGQLAQQWLYGSPMPNILAGTTVEDSGRLYRIGQLRAIPAQVRWLSMEPLLGPVDILPELKKGGIHWVIVGGESKQGKHPARPFDISWAEEIINACKMCGVKVFVKQLGSEPRAEGEKLGLLKDRKDAHNKVMDYWPEPLRIREVPE